MKAESGYIETVLKQESIMQLGNKIFSYFINIRSFALVCLCYCQSIVASECPQQFFDLPLPTKAKTCQVFMDALPASMTYFIANTPTQMKEYYLQTSVAFLQPRKHLGRHVLISQNEQFRIIISHDKEGAQVDLLALHK